MFCSMKNSGLPKSISTGAPKMVAGRAPDGPFWGRRQALPKFWGWAPTPAASIFFEILYLQNFH
jgi:hypothetical protein